MERLIFGREKLDKSTALVARRLKYLLRKRAKVAAAGCCSVFPSAVQCFPYSEAGSHPTGKSASRAIKTKLVTH